MSKMLDFSELLITKFCHDISGQISAIDNGLEFLKDGHEEIKNKAMELVSSSSAELVTRMNFYRYAYGNLKRNGEADIEQLSKLIQKHYMNSKIKINWQYNTDICLRGITNRACKLLINLVIITSTYLIHGGETEIKIEKGSAGKLLRITGRGRDIKVNPEHKSILTEHNEADPTIFNIQVFLTRKLADELNAQLQMDYSNSHITFYAEL
ncbi:hypothetical protein H1Q59_01830 [Holosporaceae bacterium 'Namur']|nr:hypothetical protein [Holosporaceae bacterium 'Namur']